MTQSHTPERGGELLPLTPDIHGDSTPDAAAIQETITALKVLREAAEIEGPEKETPWRACEDALEKIYPRVFILLCFTPLIVMSHSLFAMMFQVISAIIFWGVGTVSSHHPYVSDSKLFMILLVLLGGLFSVGEYLVVFRHLAHA
ncbi:hypothetical protein J1782_07140 [Rahnella sp. BCC 1045]|uniref:hypothetical protein n=1 Tax=Rahnella sp. BCC 1045 TaxID=2816251 RepID=UPI001C25D936|nr:hypothetical protein [Rahnella sp. BCC 1045]MBU9819660.1 hypothetical protein [Rahnella sp. BCC 1045]